MLVVLDTNVLVSAFWSRNNNPAKIIELVQNGIITTCYDNRIIKEYKEVLLRPKFGFEIWEVNSLLSQIIHDGLSVVAKFIDMPFIDEADKKFYEVATQCNANLITGNIKHFPDDSLVITPTEFFKNIKEE